MGGILAKLIPVLTNLFKGAGGGAAVGGGTSGTAIGDPSGVGGMAGPPPMSPSGGGGTSGVGGILSGTSGVGGILKGIGGAFGSVGKPPPMVPMDMGLSAPMPALLNLQPGQHASPLNSFVQTLLSRGLMGKPQQ